jgi:hypothetical protein
MKLSSLLVPAFALAGAAGLASMNLPAGEKADYSFREPPTNSLGIKSMAELRGKPVLVDFWGIN